MAGPLALLPVYHAKTLAPGDMDLPGKMAARQLLMALCFELCTVTAIDLTRQIALPGGANVRPEDRGSRIRGHRSEPLLVRASRKPSRNLQAEQRLPEGVGTLIWGPPPDS